MHNATANPGRRVIDGLSLSQNFFWILPYFLDWAITVFGFSIGVTEGNLFVRNLGPFALLLVKIAILPIALWTVRVYRKISFLYLFVYGFVCVWNVLVIADKVL